MSMPTFHYPALSVEPGQLIHLEGREAWHALGVRRLGVGDGLRVINGQGLVGLAVVDAVGGRNSAGLRVKAVERVPPLSPDIVLASAIAKGDRQATMLDMATQLGISAYQPLDCERGVGREGKHSAERWKRICLQACKQSGGAWLPEILPAASPADAVADAIAAGRQAIFAHPGGRALASLPLAAAVVVLIGPEGGFSDAEWELMTRRGALAVDLGQQILRIETAATALLARLRIS